LPAIVKTAPSEGLIFLIKELLLSTTLRKPDDWSTASPIGALERAFPPFLSKKPGGSKALPAIVETNQYY
jgi:hypothetical protein